MKKRLISLLLAFSMMLTFLPAGAVSAFAEEEELGIKLQGGQTVKEPGTYYLEGPYTQQITFDVEKSGTVKVNLKGNVIFDADRSNCKGSYKAFLYFKNVENAEIDGTRGTYTGDTFIEFRGKTAKITGGTYTHKRSSVYQSELIAPVYGTTTIDNVTMTSDTYCVRSSEDTRVIIQNSNITGTTNLNNVRLIDCYSLELTNNIVKASGSNFTAVYAEDVVINSGTYTSEGGAAVVIADNGTQAAKSIVNGGTFNGWVTNQNKNLSIHGGTFNGMTDRGAFSNSGTVVIDNQNSEPTFQCKTASENGVVENTGTMTINAGTIDASGDPTQTAIYTIKQYGQTPPNLVVNDVTLKNAKYGIRMQRYMKNAIPCVTLRKASFENVGCKVYLGKDTKIGVADTYTDEVTIECADPSDGRQLTETTIGTNYQKDLNLTSADAGYLVGYKTEDGKEYRCLSKKVGVTVSDPEGEVKAGDPAKFTVTLVHTGSTGTGILTFGDKNSEIEYKDEESGEYKPMPEGGLKIGLGDGEVKHEFRITPKETGKQTLTAAVKKDEKELATDEKDFVVSEMPILTLKDGVITSVTVPGKNGADPEDITEIVKKNANEDGSFHVPEGATVSVAFDKDAFADSGLKFGHWDITGLDDPNAYQDKESFAFVMPAKAVTLKAMTQDASIEDDEPDIVGPIVIGTTVVVGGAVLGYQAYSLGAEFAGKLMALPYFPSNRSALAMMLWEDAGKPMPESELLYPDVGQEERDMDLQHAARWAMENELIPDLNDEGTAPEEMKFYPDNAVSEIDVLNAWQKAQELKQNA